MAFSNGGRAKKTRLMPLPDGEKFDDAYNHLDTISAVYGRSDRRTEMVN